MSKQHSSAAPKDAKPKQAPCDYCGRPAPAITGMRLCDECKAEHAKGLTGLIDTIEFDELL